tara:strand:- start:1234 stop:1932 length:699 start_codon:yes stop_codon:yes gene_type:complete
MKLTTPALICAILASGAYAGMNVSTYDDLAEAFYGDSFNYDGVTYYDVNNVDGVFPSGDTFEAGGGINGLGTTVIVENAAVLYNDFPTWGSANNALTFGTSFVTGNNVSLGALSTVSMALDNNADFASVEIAYYENGPWGGIQYHLEAYLDGALVDSDFFSISDLGGRDNIAFNTLTVEGGVFDSMRLFATFGEDYSGPRALLDNLTINTVPAPGSIAVLLGAGGFIGRRRR